MHCKKPHNKALQASNLQQASQVCRTSATERASNRGGPCEELIQSIDHGEVFKEWHLIRCHAAQLERAHVQESVAAVVRIQNPQTKLGAGGKVDLQFRRVAIIQRLRCSHMERCPFQARDPIRRDALWRKHYVAEIHLQLQLHLEELSFPLRFATLFNWLRNPEYGTKPVSTDWELGATILGCYKSVFRNQALVQRRLLLALGVPLRALDFRRRTSQTCIYLSSEQWP